MQREEVADGSYITGSLTVNTLAHANTRSVSRSVRNSNVPLFRVIHLFRIRESTKTALTSNKIRAKKTKYVYIKFNMCL